MPTPTSRSQRLHLLLEPARRVLIGSRVMVAVRSETIRLRQYITLLHALRGIYATMDARLPELPLRLPIAPLLRLPGVDADLRLWDPATVMRTPPSEPRIALLERHGLVGALYALEGSRRAIPDLAIHLARSFALREGTATGLSHHASADPVLWLQCIDAIDRLILTAAQEEAVDHGATAAMNLLLECHHGIVA